MNRNTIRIREGMIHTPVYEFQHSETKSSVSLVGAIHIGSQSYYDHITELLLSREEQGTEIHYEMLKKSPDNNPGHTSEELQLLADLSESMAAFVELVTNSLEAVKQKEAVAYSDTWKNHDISMAEFVSLLGEEEIRDMIKSSKALETLKKDMDPELITKVVSGFFKMMPFFMLLKKIGIGNNKHRDAIIIDYRNAVALRGVKSTLKQNPDSDVALFWGAGHLPGLSDGLEKMGYRISSRRWLGALALK